MSVHYTSVFMPWTDVSRTRPRACRYPSSLLALKDSRACEEASCLYKRAHMYGGTLVVRLESCIFSETACIVDLWYNRRGHASAEFLHVN